MLTGCLHGTHYHRGLYTAPQEEAVVKSAMQLLQKHLTAPFNLSLINLGATNFKQDPTTNGPGSGGGGPSGGASTIAALFNRHANRRNPASGGDVAAGNQCTATDVRGWNGRQRHRSDGGSSEGGGQHSSGSEEEMQYEGGGRGVLQTYRCMADHTPSRTSADAGGAGATVDVDEARRAAQQSVALRRDYSNSPKVGVRARGMRARGMRARGMLRW